MSHELSTNILSGFISFDNKILYSTQDLCVQPSWLALNKDSNYNFNTMEEETDSCDSMHQVGEDDKDAWEK